MALAALSAAMLAFSGVAQARTGCVSALLDDWRDGRIDGTYSVQCYQTALSQLPEDLRIYSSAESDIKRALLARGKVTVSAPAKAQKPTASTAGGGVSPFLVLAIAGVIVAALGSAFALAR
ncbi:MAG: hypothetical protein QOE13_167 [Gaiellaceae bacterium]|nr:hypothetical protein [Gaiellaceae bacterium]